MKTSAILIAATAAGFATAVEGPGKPGDTKISCSKANANFCMGAGIIVRCDGDAVGTKSYCSDDLTDKGPGGADVDCWQSSEQAGDAVCVKDCMVYGSDSSSTFTAGSCATGANTATGTAANSASTTWSATTSSSAMPNTTVTTWTTATTTAAPSSSWTSDDGEGCPGPTTTAAGDNGSSTSTGMGNGGSGSGQTSSSGGDGDDSDATKTAATTSGTAATTTQNVPTAGAVANRAGGVLAAAGIVAAYLV